MGILHQANSWKEVADFLVAGIIAFGNILKGWQA